MPLLENKRKATWTTRQRQPKAVKLNYPRFTKISKPSPYSHNQLKVRPKSNIAPV